MQYSNNDLICLILLMIFSFVICSCENNVYIDGNIINGERHLYSDHIHSFTSGQYMIYGSEGHCELCAILGCPAEGPLEAHVIKWQYDETYHWQGCFCGYPTNAVKEEHTYTSNSDICNTCGYNKNQPAGFSIYLDDESPNYHISDFKVESGKFSFKLVPGSTSKSEPTSISWKVFYFEDNYQEVILATDTTNKYTFSFEPTLITDSIKGKRIYVMCTYSNKYGTLSDTFEKYGFEFFKIGGIL